MENNSIKDIIRGVDFRFNKALGQNFITDSNLLDAIVADSGINGDDTVVEIGTGAGTLTRAIAKVAKKVYSFEVDKNLQPVLALSLQGVDNAEVVFRDVLKMKDDELRSIVGDKFKVVANLPYYITTPLAMRFIESSLDVRSITIMVQKEVALRFVAKLNTADYSAITLAIEMAGDAKITRNVIVGHFFSLNDYGLYFFSVANDALSVYFNRVNSRFAFRVVVVSISSSVTPSTSAAFFATSETYFGSLILPLYGTGVIYGQSVSKRSLSFATLASDWILCFAFLNVIAPPKA